MTDDEFKEGERFVEKLRAQRPDDIKKEIPADWEDQGYGPPLGWYVYDFIIEPCLVESDDAWKAQLEVNKSGNLVASVNNVLLILENDPAWDGVLAKDARTLELRIQQPPPFGKDSEGKRLICDNDATLLRRWLEIRYRLKISKAMAFDVLVSGAEQNQFDRVREYLESLTWDGVERLPQLLPVYFGSIDNAYTQAIGCRWMISAVARTFWPGCKADHVLVIEGDQGIGKSTAARVLCSDEYFGDNIPPVDSKDAQQYIDGKWIIELAEMDAANRAEASTLKSFITTDNDKYRPSYGRYMVNQPRRCVFVGTVNHDTYLKDETGGRRFWCFAATQINLEGIKADRDQLWAEAVHRYKDGQPWHLVEPELIELAKSEQADRLDEDPWQARISTWLDLPVNRWASDQGITSATVLEDALELEPGRQNQSHMNRIGRVMRALGWKAQRKRTESGVLRVWRS